MSRSANSTAASLAGRVLVVDDHARARESISDVLRHSGHQVQCCSSAVEGVKLLESESFDVVITDLQMPGMSGLEFIQHIDRRDLGVQVVMVTAHATVASAVEAMRYGAFDYIEKPFGVDQLETLVGRAMHHGRLLDQQGPLRALAGSDTPCMIGTSGAMAALRARLARVAPTPETVLIVGESGTGKELVARAVHRASRRAEAPLVSLNCPVLSEQLMESELFGHERGAFTGADSARTGRFELADQATLLLDEITEIALPLQAKLLRVLQEQSFERVGSSETIDVDVRVLATTNRDLQHEIRSGTFREDLYYRLAVVPLTVPPLRERLDDVPELIKHFLQRAAARLEREPCRLEPGAVDLLSHYHWPGNVRELENIVTRASVLNQGGCVTAEDLQPWLIDGPQLDATPNPNVPVGLSLEEMERRLIEATLQQYEGHRAKTAHALGIGIRTLSGKLKAYGYAPRAKSAAV